MPNRSLAKSDLSFLASIWFRYLAALFGVLVLFKRDSLVSVPIFSFTVWKEISCNVWQTNDFCLRRYFGSLVAIDFWLDHIKYWPVLLKMLSIVFNQGSFFVLLFKSAQ